MDKSVLDIDQTEYYIRPRTITIIKQIICQKKKVTRMSCKYFISLTKRNVDEIGYSNEFPLNDNSYLVITSI